jgi:hypothetical protein
MVNPATQVHRDESRGFALVADLRGECRHPYNEREIII